MTEVGISSEDVAVSEDEPAARHFDSQARSWGSSGEQDVDHQYPL